MSEDAALRTAMVETLGSSAASRPGGDARRSSGEMGRAPSSSLPPTRLRRSLTLGHAVLYGLGVTIGAGIYVLVGAAAGRSGMSAPLAFVVAALAMGFTAATFAELGTRMPVSASEAAYAQAAFRRRSVTLAVGLLVLGAASVSGATISVGSAGYLSTFLPGPSVAIVAGVVVAAGLVACLPTAGSVGFAGALTLVEVGGLALLIGAGAINGGDVIARLPELWPGDGRAALAGLAQTALLAVFAFLGFEHLVNVAEEMRDPARTLPRALLATLALTAALYALVVWIAVVTVPPAELARSPAPLALVFTRLTGWPPAAMSAIAVVATLNGVIVHIVLIARVLYGMAEQGSLPRGLARLHAASATPIVATLVAAGAVLLLALAAPLAALAEATARLTLVIFAIMNLALIRIRRRGDPAPPGAFRGPSWTPHAGLASSLGLLAADAVVR